MTHHSIHAPIAFIGALALMSVSCSHEADHEVATSLLNLCSVGNSQMSSSDKTQGAKIYTRAYTPGDLFTPGTGSGKDLTNVPPFLRYDKLYPVPINKDYTTIGAFLADNNKDVCTTVDGFFKYVDANTWNTSVAVRPGDFYIFGYMPSNIGSVSASITKRNGSWENGCVMTINNLSTVTPADVCVVVGVLKGQDRTKDITHADVLKDLHQGQYAYEGTKDQNYVYLLLDHIYTNVNLELSVEKKYSELRTIVLKKVLMKSDVRSTVDAVITLGTSRTNPIEALTFTPVSEPPVNAVLFPEAEQYATAIAVEGEGVTSVPGYFAPGMTTQAFDFEFIYDVYDKKNIDAEHPYGNCVRKDCHAINHWQLGGDEVQAGRSFKVTATIKPTYLYQLSEPDLDNPTIVLKTDPNP